MNKVIETAEIMSWFMAGNGALFSFLETLKVFPDEVKVTFTQSCSASAHCLLYSFKSICVLSSISASSREEGALE